LNQKRTDKKQVGGTHIQCLYKLTFLAPVNLYTPKHSKPTPDTEINVPHARALTPRTVGDSNLLPPKAP
jgi:hypothetical protein